MSLILYHWIIIRMIYFGDFLDKLWHEDDEDIQLEGEGKKNNSAGIAGFCCQLILFTLFINAWKDEQLEGYSCIPLTDSDPL